MKDANKRLLWEELLNNYKEYFMTFDEIWHTTYDNLIKFINEHKKRPSKHSKNIEEKHLGSWIGTQQNNYTKNEQSMKDANKRLLWEELLNNYKEYLMTIDEIWQTTYDNLIKFINEHKKRPSDSSKNIEEKHLGCWICNQQNNYKKNENSMKDANKRLLWEELLNNYKEYLMTFDEIWQTTYYNLIKFINEHKKRPSETSKNIEEKQLGMWISTQQNNYKKNDRAMKDANKRLLWEELLNNYKEYLMTLDEKWHTTYDNLIKFMNEHKKRPSESSKNIEEKQLAKWVSHQQSNYKNNENSMKDADKRLLWEELLNNYKEYFRTVC
jgi:hypothetical protein